MIDRPRPARAADPAGTGLEPAGDGMMWLDRRFRSELTQAGLTGLKAVMHHADGRCLRVLKDRENWYLTLHDGDQRSRGMYLKRHHVRTVGSRLRARLGTGPGETAGKVEAQHVAGLSRRGIDVMRLVAYGQRLGDDGRLESFLLTEELEGYVELQQFIRRRFAQRPGQRAVRRDPDLDRLIRQIAGIVRRFHRAGYNHRDLYCCHFLVKEPRPAEFDVRLIDLQRVQHRRRFRRRWIVKDLAQLAYSSPRDRITCTQKLAFLRHYLGVGRLRPGDKRLVRRVLAKQRAMQRKLGIES